MSHATEIAAAGDEMIQLRTVSESGKEYYSIGSKITVVWYGGERPFVCLTCRSVSCAHVDRVERYRKEAT